MAIAALEQIHAWGVARIALTLAPTTDDIARRARNIGLEPLPDDQRAAHMLGVRLPGRARERVLAALADVNCFASVRGASLRLAPHLHTTAGDVERLFAGLHSVLS